MRREESEAESLCASGFRPLPSPKPRHAPESTRAALLTRLALPLLTAAPLDTPSERRLTLPALSPRERIPGETRFENKAGERAARGFRPCPPAPDAPPQEKVGEDAEAEAP